MPKDPASTPATAIAVALYSDVRHVKSGEMAVICLDGSPCYVGSMARYEPPPRAYESYLGWAVTGLGLLLVVGSLTVGIRGVVTSNAYNFVATFEIFEGLFGLLVGVAIAAGGIAVLRQVKRRAQATQS